MKKIVLIGIDGFDPQLAERMLGAGELPGFSLLQQKGGWSRLQTTNPALSPTAWSTIATGCNPGVHGLFDFIGRDVGSYLPTLSLNRPNPRNYFGSRSKAFLPARQGEAFWTKASAQKIPTRVIKWPASFPPEPVAGAMLSGLGVPDVRGTLGRYTFYSSAAVIPLDKTRGDVLRLTSRGPHIETVLIGPDGVTAPMVIRVDSGEKAQIEVQDHVHALSPGRWSPWVLVTFRRFGFSEIRGIFRLYLESLTPEVRLYASAIHIDPRSPVVPISSPASYANELAEALGAFHTLGLPEETNGLVDEVISEEAFLQHADDLFKEREALFEYEWQRFQEGLFVFVFDTLDRIQHTQWSGLSGPSAQTPDALRRMTIIREHYRKLDRVVGRLIKNLADDDLLLVVSDHGFSTFDKALNINSWLRDQGLLTLKEGKEGLPLFENVDWRKTQAYALGFASLYLNRRGREPDGIVSDEEASALQGRLIAGLQSWKDPDSAEPVVHAVYDSRTLYQGPRRDQGPDLVLAPRAGYRVSWQTGYGAAPYECIEKNNRAWRADHIVDPSLVPGVLFANQSLNFSQPSVIHIAPTLLDALSIPPGKEIEGQSLLDTEKG